MHEECSKYSTSKHYGISCVDYNFIFSSVYIISYFCLQDFWKFLKLSFLVSVLPLNIYLISLTKYYNWRNLLYHVSSMPCVPAWSTCPRANVPKSCQLLIFTCQRVNVPKARQFFNYFSKELENRAYLVLKTLST